MPPRRKFAQTLAMWRRATGDELVAIRAEAAGLLAESLALGGRFGPGTPIKTGRLISGWTAESRAGWRSSVGTKGPTGDIRDAPDVQRARVPGWLRRVRTMATKADIRIYTEVPYAEYVNEGHPTKRQFITRVRDNWPLIVQTARARVRVAAAGRRR